MSTGIPLGSCLPLRCVGLDLRWSPNTPPPGLGKTQLPVKIRTSGPLGEDWGVGSYFQTLPERLEVGVQDANADKGEGKGREGEVATRMGVGGAE